MYSDDLRDEVMRVVECGFLDKENVCIACDISKPESVDARNDLIRLCDEVAKDGVSIVAVHKSTNKIVGLSFNKIQVLEEDSSFFGRFKDNDCTSVNSRALMQIMIDIDSRFDFFKHFKTNCLFEVMFLGTHPDFVKKGIAKQLVIHSLEIARQLKNGVRPMPIGMESFKPTIASAIWTSIYSQKIALACNFKMYLDVPYTDLEFDGVSYDTRITNTKAMSLGAIEL